MIAGCDSDIAPAFQLVTFGLVKLISTVVDCPTLTVAAVTVGVVVVNCAPLVPVRLTIAGDAVKPTAPLIGTVNVAVCAAAAVGA